MKKIFLFLFVLMMLVSLVGAQSNSYVWEEKFPSNSPGKRFAAVMEYDPGNNVIILFGGEDSSLTLLDETWVWDGVDWQQLFPDNTPGKRQGHRMVYDTQVQRILLFGGYSVNNDGNNDLWVWDGTNWHELEVVGDRPQPRWGYAMAYDSVNGRVYLFGGFRASGYTWYSDLWYFENNSWTFVADSGSLWPQARHNASMVFDEVNGVLFLHGGHLEYDNIFNDTWIWDGNEWAELYPQNPPSNYDYFAMEYNKKNGFIIKFGGYTTPGESQNETWVWDGNDWSMLELDILPPPRYGMAHAYFESEDKVVIFGGDYGITAGCCYYGDTWEFGPISVTIDIKPGSYPNSINLGSNGNVPVAIFSTEDFDATTVDPLTVTLAGAVVRIKGKGDSLRFYEDIDGDGLLDILVHIDTRTFALSGIETEAILEGYTFDGRMIRGVDTVRIVQD